MKTPAYWIDKFNSEFMIKEIQKDAYNSAIKDAIDKAKWRERENETDCGISNELACLFKA